MKKQKTILRYYTIDKYSSLKGFIISLCVTVLLLFFIAVNISNITLFWGSLFFFVIVCSSYRYDSVFTFNKDVYTYDKYCNIKPFDYMLLMIVKLSILFLSFVILIGIIGLFSKATNDIFILFIHGILIKFLFVLSVVYFIHSIRELSKDSDEITYTIIGLVRYVIIWIIGIVYVESVMLSDSLVVYLFTLLSTVVIFIFSFLINISNTKNDVRIK